jgi:hypothetical protein
MRIHRRPRITRADAEALLGGAGPEPVSRLLAAAVAPGMAHELTGEQAALAELRAAQPRTVPRRRAPVLKARLANLSVTKLLTGAAIATAASGGVALAAVTGVLPTPQHPSAHSASAGTASNSAPSGRAQTAGPRTRARGATRAVVSDGSKPIGSRPPAATSNPTPQLELTGLCKAYQARARASSHGKVLDNPAFTVLVTAAGGRDQVATYCATLIGPAPTHPSGSPTTYPSGPPARRSGPPTTHRTGPPATHPSGPPTAHSTPPAHSPHP